MKKLLQHLLAHLRTSDPWIVIYDSCGTFSRIIGDCILMDSSNTNFGVFLGVPVWREYSCKNSQISDTEFFVLMKREYLGRTIARIKELMASCA